jgi:isoquinoline 1-oxidoreductase subunit beta
MGAAKKGIEALVIEWDDGPHAELTTDAIAAELEQAMLKSGAVAENIGDVDRAIASAVTEVKATYQLPFLAHATMEPMNCTVHVRRTAAKSGSVPSPLRRPTGPRRKLPACHWTRSLCTII